MVGPANHKLQAPTNRLTIYVRAVIKYAAWSTVVQKRKPYLPTVIGQVWVNDASKASPSVSLFLQIKLVQMVFFDGAV